MQVRSSFWKLIIAIVLVTGVVVACAGPQTPEPPAEAEPAVSPTEVPPEEEAAPPTEATQEEQPTTPPTEAPQEETGEQPAEPAPEGDGAALLEERCATCHGLDRTTSARKTREQWEQTVTRMVAKGAELNAEEQDILIAYLAETYGP